MTQIKRLQRWTVVVICLMGGALAWINTASAQNITGDPWKMLILVYRNIDTTYVDIDGATKRLTATMPLSDAENMVNSFLNLPHRTNVYEYSANLAELEAHIQYVDRPLTDLESISFGYWPSPDVTRPELDEYAPPGLYDSVIVFWQASHPDTGQSIPVYAWGLGYWPHDYANGMTYATIFNLSWVWTSDVCEGEVFLHEWLHGVTGFYSDALGFQFPVEDLHGAEEAGYTTDANGCWKPWLIDYMQGKVLENGQYKALVPETWHSGSVTTYDIQGWRAEFYNNKTLSGLPVIVRDDAAINFQWASGSPHPLVNPDHFSTRWEKEVYFDSGHYLFTIFRDDGLRILIDGNLVFNEWEYGAEWRYRDIPITAGWHTVTVEQYEIDGWAGAMVNWEPFSSPHEWEGNNNPGYANSITSNIHGLIDPMGDLDYYWFSGQAGQQLVAEITADLIGSQLDSYLTLYDSDGMTILAENDDYNNLDSRIQTILPHNGIYYLEVQDYYSSQGGPGFFYNLSMSLTNGSFDVFYISPANNKTIAGIAATSADILRYEKSTDTWTMIYDGSVRGTTKNVSAFDIMDDGSLLLVFSANQKMTIEGSTQTATPYDVVKFTPYNPNVFPLGGGTYEWYFRGKTHDLSTGAEKIDALDYAGNRLLLSTTGTAKITVSGASITVTKEDVFAYNTTTDQWESTPVIDGSIIPELKGKNISSVWDDPNSDDYYVTVTGAFKIGGVKGNAQSIVKLTPSGSSFTPSFVDWLAPGQKFPSNLDGLDIAP